MASYSSNTGNQWTLIVDVTNVEVDTPNNRSKVAWSVKLKDVNRAIQALCTYHLSINGTNVWVSASSGTTITDLTMDNTVTLASGTTGWISHNSDGSKSVAISAGIKSNVSTAVWSIPQLSISQTLPLTTIPRASQPTLNYSTRALGSAITIYTNRASSSFTHTLTYSFGNQSGTIATGVTTSQSWTLPASLASAIPNATSGTGTITCKTYNGQTLIGSKSVSFTATVPNNSTFQPTATISSIVEGNTLPSGVTVFVQNKSKAKVASTGTGKHSSTIENYSVSVAGIGTYTGSSITSAFLKNSGSVRVTLTVTDSRGLKGSTYKDITVVAYSPPKISTFNAQRSESTPSNIAISYNASISSVSNQNGVVYRIRSLASGGSWVVNNTVTTGYLFSGTQTIVTDPDKTYTIEIYVADKWTSITRTVQVGTSFTLIDFNESGRGMAIGKVSESNSFEVAIPMKTYQPITDATTNNPYLYKSATTTINTFENGWEGSITLSRFGDLVSIKGNLTKTGTVTIGTQLIVIPVDFRPSMTTPIAVSKGNVSPYNSSFLFWLLSSGVLEVRTSDTIPANQSNAQLRINQVYSV